MSYPRSVVPLGAFFSFCLLATVHAQSPGCDPQALARDPATSDSLYPPALQAVQIPSSGARMNGVLYLAQGKGPHSTVLFLHGFPGAEENIDLAQAVRRAGFNTLVFHYRGAWGSEGAYSYSHVLEDVAAALQWLRTPAVADSYRVDRRHLILIGHSLGGFAALYVAAIDSDVEAVAALAPADLGRRGERLRDPEVFDSLARWREQQLGPLRGTTGKTLGQDLLEHATQWHLDRYGRVLAGRRVLLIAATRDSIVPLTEVYEPLGAELRRLGARQLTAETLESDHAFSNARVRLAGVLLRWLCSER